MLALAPDVFEANLNFSAVPWLHGVLEPKAHEFICIAIDAATTHLCAPGTRVHIRNAIRLGATRQEIMERLELTSVPGIHSTMHGVPILLEELQTAGKS
ncbi:carboxymuconolactone decarboxylase family protein [Roseicella aquatilis]|uniref:carboxymuconolactone decarboxylase family protein n=1 Tax=Roseicella aquatilis TaxID=2527868 RepID=UPI00197D474A|nr:carboxymuconolactone decarboxylase family protein [Roseicella aquatilis]